MENVKQGIPTTRNIYKEHRQKIEQAKIDQIVAQKEKVIAETKERAKKTAIEIANREHVF